MRNSISFFSFPTCRIRRQVEIMILLAIANEDYDLTFQLGQDFAQLEKEIGRVPSLKEFFQLKEWRERLMARISTRSSL